MLPAPIFRIRGINCRSALIALLVAFCFACNLAPGFAAAAPEHSALVAAPPAVVVANFVNDVQANRTLMIQTACVFVAIGVFLLTRSIR